jgi:hypothetical protein
LGFTSPPSAVLCSATTATCPSRFPSLVARPPIPGLFRLFVSFLQARQGSGTFASTPGLLGHPVRRFRVAHQETSGSPKFPGYPIDYMPRSSTPVVSLALALARSGLRPSASMTASAFPPIKPAVILTVHNYTIFEALSHGLFSCSPRLQTSVTGFTCEVHYCPVG